MHTYLCRCLDICGHKVAGRGIEALLILVLSQIAALGHNTMTPPQAARHLFLGYLTMYSKCKRTCGWCR
uniref:Secreted protein n=1 Tax=Steinernema glaseri TaxID=37863 RepID=A0A1I7YN34_9BILA